MTKYIYESKGVKCPECGEVVHELFNVESKSGQEVLLCDACNPRQQPQADFSWIRGGINE